MDEINDVLNQLAAAPVPIQLASIDERVWSGIATYRQDIRFFIAVGIVVAAGAIAMGVGVGVASPTPTAAPTSLSLDSPLAPSALLAGVQ